MQVFKTDKNTFLRNELVSWLGTVLFTLLLYVGFKSFSSQPDGRLLVPVCLVILFKLRDTLTHFHIREIKVDEQANQLTFVLHSVMAGERLKSYNLRLLKSDIIRYSGLLKIFRSSATLKVTLPNQETFRVSTRYGFSANTLTIVDKTLNQTSTLQAYNDSLN